MKPNKNSTFNQFTGASEFIRASTQTADIKNYLKANKNSDNTRSLILVDLLYAKAIRRL